jgi:ADP-ribosylglycohydrolase
VGDALGAPVEFMRRAEIAAQFGEQGIQNYVPAYGRLGAITDDTQMALFTAEGMLRAWTRLNERGIGPSFAATSAHAYLRWLQTQGYKAETDLHTQHPGWLITHKELFSKRAPGTTCISALRAFKDGNLRASNDSKGCGGVMRMAPVGMFMAQYRGGKELDAEYTFQVAADIAAITHGHPTGQLAAGAFAVLIAILIRGGNLPQALVAAKDQLRRRDHHEETCDSLERAEKFSRTEPSSPAAIKKLGGGWVAEEALAISVYCALGAKNFQDGVVLAVNHDGDSDSTGAMAGNLLGCLHGISRIPARWLALLELRELIVEIADDLATYPKWNLGLRPDEPEAKFYYQRYPPN